MKSSLELTRLPKVKKKNCLISIAIWVKRKLSVA